jgi:hypothetical protein
MDSGKRKALARDAAALVEGGDAALDKIAVPVGLSVVFDRLYAVRVRRDDGSMPRSSGCRSSRCRRRRA